MPAAHPVEFGDQIMTACTMNMPSSASARATSMLARRVDRESAARVGEVVGEVVGDVLTGALHPAASPVGIGQMIDLQVDASMCVGKNDRLVVR
jgi:hypothetical protein